MTMKWLTKPSNGKIQRGDDNPPDGDVYFVDGQGSMAMVGGVLYVNGVTADVGAYTVSMMVNDLPITVPGKGKKAKKWKLTKRGGNPNGK